MKTVEVKKLWQGKYVSVREGDVSEAINRGGLVINHDGASMQMLPDELARLEVSPKVYKSKYNQGKTYRLVDIVFRPEDIRQTNLEF